MSDLPAQLDIVTAEGRPTMGFLAAWRGAGALSPLPAAIVVTGPDGASTGPFFRQFKAAFPANRLSARDCITAGRRATPRFLAVWSQATA